MSSLPKPLQAYERYSGKAILSEIALLSQKLSGKSVQFICSAIPDFPESAGKIVGLLGELGLKVVITDTPDPAADYIFVFCQKVYSQVRQKNRGTARWIWAGEEIKEDRALIALYDAAVFSSPVLSQTLPIPQYLVPYAIDPLDSRNRELSAGEISRLVKRFGVEGKKPLLVMASSSSAIKDQAALRRMHEMIKKKNDCQLIIAGKGEVSDLEVNALQRQASVVLMQSGKGSPGEQVAEALWKGKPVVLSAANGSPFQIIHNVTGLLVHSVEGAAYQVRYLLNNKERARSLGKAGQGSIKENYLITNGLKAYLLVMLAVAHPDWKLIEI